MTIRAAAPGDFEAIDAVVAAAFSRSDEAVLVRALRAVDPLLELVSEDRGGAGGDAGGEAGGGGYGIAGHILFSRAWIETADGERPAAQLAPVAVAPARQNAGLGGALIREGMAALAARGETHVFVLGHPDYYPRFGFSAEAAKAYDAPWSGRAFLLAHLSPGGPERGRLRVSKAFA